MPAQTLSDRYNALRGDGWKAWTAAVELKMTPAEARVCERAYKDDQRHKVRPGAHHVGLPKDAPAFLGDLDPDPGASGREEKHLRALAKYDGFPKPRQLFVRGKGHVTVLIGASGKLWKAAA